MLIETELTPNPATIKFLPGRIVMDNGTRDFADPEEATASPLAEALFNLGDVTGVFFGREFISVTAAPGTEWATLKPDVLGILLTTLAPICPCSMHLLPDFRCRRPTRTIPLDDPCR